MHEDFQQEDKKISYYKQLLLRIQQQNDKMSKKDIDQYIGETPDALKTPLFQKYNDFYQYCKSKNINFAVLSKTTFVHAQEYLQAASFYSQVQKTQDKSWKILDFSKISMDDKNLYKIHLSKDWFDFFFLDDFAEYKVILASHDLPILRELCCFQKESKMSNKIKSVSISDRFHDDNSKKCLTEIYCSTGVEILGWKQSSEDKLIYSFIEKTKGSADFSVIILQKIIQDLCVKFKSPDGFDMEKVKILKILYKFFEDHQYGVFLSYVKDETGVVPLFYKLNQLYSQEIIQTSTQQSKMNIKNQDIHFYMTRVTEENIDSWSQYYKTQSDIAQSISQQAQQGVVAAIPSISYYDNYKTNVYVAYASVSKVSDPDNPDSDQIECYVTVTTSDHSNFSSHMGISHAYFTDGRKAITGLSLPLQGFAAQALSKIFPEVKLMVNAPVENMRDMLISKLNAGGDQYSYVFSFKGNPEGRIDKINLDYQEMIEARGINPEDIMSTNDDVREGLKAKYSLKSPDLNALYELVIDKKVLEILKTDSSETKEKFKLLCEKTGMSSFALDSLYVKPIIAGLHFSEIKSGQRKISIKENIDQNDKLQSLTLFDSDREIKLDYNSSLGKYLWFFEHPYIYSNKNYTGLLVTDINAIKKLFKPIDGISGEFNRKQILSFCRSVPDFLLPIQHQEESYEDLVKVMKTKDLLVKRCSRNDQKLHDFLKSVSKEIPSSISKEAVQKHVESFCSSLEFMPDDYFSSVLEHILESYSKTHDGDILPNHNLFDSI